MAMQVDDKKRVANWSVPEKAVLLEYYEKHNSELFGRIKSSEFKRKRDECWREVADAVSRVGCGRTVLQCHKKLENIISQTKLKNRLQKHTPTGGGERKCDFNAEESVVVRTIGDTPTMNGILPDSVETLIAETLPGSICFNLNNDSSVVQDLLTELEVLPGQSLEMPPQSETEVPAKPRNSKRLPSESIESLRKTALREEIEMIKVQKTFWTNAVEFLDKMTNKFQLNSINQNED